MGPADLLTCRAHVMINSRFHRYARLFSGGQTYEDIPLHKDVCFAAEVGLSGEIRPVQRVEQRIIEAEKLGFAAIYVSKYNKISLKNSGIKIHLISKIEDLVSQLL